MTIYPFSSFIKSWRLNPVHDYIYETLICTSTSLHCGVCVRERGGVESLCKHIIKSLKIMSHSPCLWPSVLTLSAVLCTDSVPQGPQMIRNLPQRAAPSTPICPRGPVTSVHTMSHAEIMRGIQGKPSFLEQAAHLSGTA